MKRTSKWVLCGLGVAALVGYGLLLWHGPWWVDGSHLRRKNLEPADGIVITGFRTACIALGAGALAALGLFYTHKSHQQTEKLFMHTLRKDSEDAALILEGQSTQRFVEAMKLLSSRRLTGRLGGIYSLERIMRDSERNHAAIVAVLAAFIRDQSPNLVPEGEPAVEQDEAHPAEDVQAALSVLAKRPVRAEGFRINLASTDLRGADLSGAHLDRVDLSFTRLDGANMMWASMQGALLDHTNLSKANLMRSHLEGATLYGVQMEETWLGWAHLNPLASIGGHSDVFGGLLKAILTSTTELPFDFEKESAIQSRIRECESVWQFREPPLQPVEGYGIMAVQLHPDGSM
jgi:hypothetical protein